MNGQMEREKQINEMAFNLIMATSPLGVKDLTKVFDYNTVAKDLYELYGWRKERQGEWKMVKYPLTKCSNCDVVRNCEIDTGWKYCPECGAHMKGAE